MKNALNIVGLMVLLIVSGCSSVCTSLSKQEPVSVEKRDSEKIEILWADVYRENGQTWGCATLQQKSTTSGTIKSHIDLQIVAPDGSVQYTAVSKELYIPPKRTGKLDSKKVRVKLPNDIPEGSKIIMAIHSDKRKDCLKSSKTS